MVAVAVEGRLVGVVRVGGLRLNSKGSVVKQEERTRASQWKCQG